MKEDRQHQVCDQRNKERAGAMLRMRTEISLYQSTPKTYNIAHYDLTFLIFLEGICKQHFKDNTQVVL